MKSKISAVISCIAATLMLVFSVSAEVPSDILSSRLAECGAETVQEWLDTELAENAGTGSEWYALTLRQSGDYDFSAYKSALEAYVESNNVRSATSRQKYALVLLAVGSDSGYVDETLENSIGEQGLMSYVYGLHLLNNGCTSTVHTIENVIGQILSMQFADGGWAVMGEYGDPDVTAMTIQALAPYYGTDEAVTKAIDKALQFLSEKQLDNGGYKSMGIETSESVSQVIIALSSLGIDAESDSRFVKNGNTLSSALKQFRLPDGSYCHEKGGESNSNSTVQAFMAETAYAEKINLYILEKNLTEEISEETTSAVTTAVVTTSVVTTSVVTEMTTPAAESTNDTVDKKKSYKPVAYAIIAGAGAVVCVILLVLNKRNIRNFIAVAVTVAIGVIIVLCTDFSSAEEYYGSYAAKENPVGTVTVEIRCDTVAGREDYIPEDGIILAETAYVIESDETVYDILVEACRENNIQTEFSGGYISGINYIYEFDFGDLSGWMYFVNDKEASVGCDSYKLADGDRIEWIYSCEMGNDLK